MDYLKDWTKGMPCEIGKADEEMFRAKMNNTFDDLAALGVSIYRRPELKREHDDTVSLFRVSYKFADEELNDFDIMNHLTLNDLEMLVQIREQLTFERRVEHLELRMACLGWECYHGKSPVRYEVHTSSNTACYYNKSSAGLIKLQEDLKYAEQWQRIIAHMDLFAQAGIYLEEKGDGAVIFTLREGDPEIRRRLTPANVDELLEMAKVLKELKRRAALA